MAITSTIVTPAASGISVGAVGGKAISYRMGGFAAPAFSVLDPSTGAEQSYSVTGSGGHTLSYGRFGTIQGGGFVVALTPTWGDLVQMVRCYPDGSYDTLPTLSYQRTPTVTATAGELWITTIDGSTAQVPLVYDLSTGAVRSNPYGGVTLAAVSCVAQPVYKAGYLYLWAGVALYKYDPATHVRTTVLAGATYYPGVSQAVVDGSYVWWIGSSGTRLIRLDTTTDTVTSYPTGVTWSVGLTLGTDGRLYGARRVGSNFFVVSYSPSTALSTEDGVSVAGTGGVGGLVTATGKVCVAVVA